VPLRLHEVQNAEFLSRMLEQAENIPDSFAVPEAGDRAAEGNGPIVAFLTKDCGFAWLGDSQIFRCCRRSGSTGSGACTARHQSAEGSR
jgi:hypothetical protein